MKSINNNKFFLVPVAIAGIAMFIACTKTEYEQLKRPYNDIERFAVSGYGELDPVYGVIEKDTIYLYWDNNVERPVTVRPTIAVSEGASIQPASGAEVGFSDTTRYVVTAEDGTERRFFFRPVLNKIIPSLFSIPDPFGFGSNVNITGQYFLADGDTSAIKVYAQRIRDGFEFDLAVDYSRVTNTTIRVATPPFSAQLDSGMHRIWVKIGDNSSNYLDTWFQHPRFANSVNLEKFNLVQEGQDVKIGDELTVDYEISDRGNSVSRYFQIGSLKTVTVVFGVMFNGREVSRYITTEHFTISGSQIKFKIPEEAREYIGGRVSQISLQFPFQYSTTNISTDGPQPLKLSTTDPTMLVE